MNYGLHHFWIRGHLLEVVGLGLWDACLFDCIGFGDFLHAGIYLMMLVAMKTGVLRQLPQNLADALVLFPRDFSQKTGTIAVAVRPYRDYGQRRNSFQGPRNGSSKGPLLSSALPSPCSVPSPSSLSLPLGLRPRGVQAYYRRH